MRIDKPSDMRASRSLIFQLTDKESMFYSNDEQNYLDEHLAMIKKNTEAYCSVPGPLQNSKEFALQALKLNPAVYYWLPEKLINDTFKSDAIKQNPLVEWFINARIDPITRRAHNERYKNSRGNNLSGSFFPPKEERKENVVKEKEQKEQEQKEQEQKEQIVIS